MFSYLLKEKSSWEKLKNAENPIAVYGTGNGADKVFAEFEKLNIRPDFVVASDSFARERTFHGYRVLPVSELEKECPDFTVALCFASNREDVIENIIRLSKKHEVIMPSVPVYGDEIFNKAYLKSHLLEIESAYSLLCDEKSRQVFKNVIEFQTTGKLDLLFDCETEKNEALSLLDLSNNEDFLDLGAYRGDTIDELITFSGGYSSITAVEPDPRSHKKLCLHCENMKNITLINAAVGNENGTVFFGGNKGRGGSVSTNGVQIPLVTVDSLCRKFSYIKADVEGEEMKMLGGMANALKLKPKLNIAAYHRSEDIFALINKIHEMNGEYEIYLRHHRHISFWDTNLYCK